MSNANPDEDHEVPSFISVSTKRDDVAVTVTIDEDEFRAAVRYEVRVYLEEQLRHPRESQLLELVGKFVESWLSRRARRRNGN